MAVQILSVEDLERNRKAFQKRLRVELRLASEAIETAIDVQIREYFFVGKTLPYEITVAIPKEVSAGEKRMVFLDVDDYCRKIIPLVRKNYSQAGWSSVVKRDTNRLRFIFKRKSGE